MFTFFIVDTYYNCQFHILEVFEKTEFYFESKAVTYWGLL